MPTINPNPQPASITGIASIPRHHKTGTTTNPAADATATAIPTDSTTRTKTIRRHTAITNRRVIGLFDCKPHRPQKARPP
jgi:hypothetical protein